MALEMAAESDLESPGLLGSVELGSLPSGVFGSRFAGSEADDFGAELSGCDIALSTARAAAVARSSSVASRLCIKFLLSMMMSFFLPLSSLPRMTACPRPICMMTLVIMSSILPSLMPSSLSSEDTGGVEDELDEPDELGDDDADDGDEEDDGADAEVDDGIAEEEEGERDDDEGLAIEDEIEGRDDKPLLLEGPRRILTRRKANLSAASTSSANATSSTATRGTDWTGTWGPLDAPASHCPAVIKANTTRHTNNKQPYENACNDRCVAH